MPGRAWTGVYQPVAGVLPRRGELNTLPAITSELFNFKRPENEAGDLFGVRVDRGLHNRRVRDSELSSGCRQRRCLPNVRRRSGSHRLQVSSWRTDPRGKAR